MRSTKKKKNSTADEQSAKNAATLHNNYEKKKKKKTVLPEGRKKKKTKKQSCADKHATCVLQHDEKKKSIAYVEEKLHVFSILFPSLLLLGNVTLLDSYRVAERIERSIGRRISLIVSTAIPKTINIKIHTCASMKRRFDLGSSRNCRR